MKSELLLESVSVLVYLALAGLFTVGGLFAEYSSLQYFTGGDLAVAVWLAVLGAIMLYAGVYGIAYKKVATKFLG